MSEELRKRYMRQPISKAELERRWRVVRTAMVEEKLDCLVMHSTGRFLGGAVRYFTDIQAVAYGSFVVFPLVGNQTLISHGYPSPASPPEWAVFDTDRISLPYIPSINFTNEMPASAAVDAIKKAKAKSIGIVGTSMMATSFYEYLKAKLNGVVFKDATDMINTIRAVKSPEEIKLMLMTCNLQDKVMYSTLAMVRPGVREYEIMSEIKRKCTDMGSEEQLVFMGSAPGGTNSGFKPEFFQNRTLQDGDYMTLLIETNGPGGYWTEIARDICIGDAPKVLLKAWDDALELQKENAKEFKPGANAKALWDLHSELLVARGYSKEERISCHSQGYDIVERPAIRPEETMSLNENMVFAIHPTPKTKEVYVDCCDNFLITPKGGVRMHKCPQQVFVV